MVMKKKFGVAMFLICFKRFHKIDNFVGFLSIFLSNQNKADCVFDKTKDRSKRTSSRNIPLVAMLIVKLHVSGRIGMPSSDLFALVYNMSTSIRRMHGARLIFYSLDT